MEKNWTSRYLESVWNFIMNTRAVVSTGSTGSIEPGDFWNRHIGTCEIAQIIRIESVNFEQD